MITSIEISRFRGIREGKLEGLTPLTVLVGANGSGKSSVLDSLLLVTSPNTQKAAQEVVQRHKGVRGGGRWFVWRADPNGNPSIAVTTAEGRSRTCKFRLQGNNLAVDPGQRRRPRAASDTPQQWEGTDELALFEPHAFEAEPPLHRLYSRSVELGQWEEAKVIVSEAVRGAVDLRLLTEGDSPVMHVVYKAGSVPAAFCGDGIYSLLRLCVELGSRRNGLVLLEEPEVHQHPGSIRQSVRAILAAVRRGIQVVLTTHSLELIDAFLAESSAEDIEKLSLYRLELERGKLIAVRIPGSEVAYCRGDVETDLR